MKNYVRFDGIVKDKIQGGGVIVVENRGVYALVELVESEAEVSPGDTISVEGCLSTEILLNLSVLTKIIPSEIRRINRA